MTQLRGQQQHATKEFFNFVPFLTLTHSLSTSETESSSITLKFILCFIYIRILPLLLTVFLSWCIKSNLCEQNFNFFLQSFSVYHVSVTHIWLTEFEQVIRKSRSIPKLEFILLMLTWIGERFSCVSISHRHHLVFSCKTCGLTKFFECILLK